jgi:predicted RNA-binding protein with PUA-like domain
MISRTEAKAKPKPKRYWLFKSEPSGYSIQDLQESPGKTDNWDGVRNYQARNFLRDDIRRGDGVLFYHSRIPEPAVVGACVVTKGGYLDTTAFDPDEKHYDPRSDSSAPRWFMVDIKLKKIFKRVVTLSEIKKSPGLEKMVVAQKGSRLSIQPVTESEWDIIHHLAGEITK